ncbi:MAG: tyrosine-type recombinase/integrase [Hungatella sp.]|nr:tyrosine-type recombinase/integrase [Hungatella sp.]
MKNYTLTQAHISSFARSLKEEEKASATIEKYLRTLQELYAWLEGREVTKEIVAQWKAYLLEKGQAPATINAKLSAVNSLFRFLGWNNRQVKFLKLQRRAFRDSSRELNREEYSRLLKAASGRKLEWLSLLMETICATGIRVSEVKYITMEAVILGRAEVNLKGKIRTILLPGKLCRKLKKFAKKKKIVLGEIFRSEDGEGLSRYQIWKAMKMLCKEADVEASKVFPHNLRHLFAATFYKVTRDIVKLADVLGHSCVETTRIYLMTTDREHVQQLEQLGLVN